jgi:endonuclease I
MKKIYSLIVFTFFTFVTFGQVSITATGTAFTQDFNTLANTGTTNALATLPVGWTFLETGTGANTTYAADNGTGNSGNTFSYGTTASTERALGGLLSGSVTTTLGASFTNNTGVNINSLTITYTGEQWRLGTASRADRLDFSYSTNATSLTTGTYTAETTLNFIAPTTSGALGAIDGNATANKTTISSTITGLSIAPGTTFWIKWSDFNATSADDGLGIDDFSISATGGADLPPTITTLTPTNTATNVAINTSLTILFNEPIVKGTGNILIKKVSDNSTVQTIDVATATPVTVTGSTATIVISPLLNSTAYYIEIPNTAFTDAALNAFAGFSGSSSWSFTTIAPPLPPAAGIINNNYSFTNCATTFLSEGWSQYSVTGPQTWACTTVGRTDANGIRMSGFTTPTFSVNEDWLISPKFDLTAVSFPTLKFYSRGEFTGNNLQLKVSNNYVSGTDPNTATWVNLNGNFPTVNTWTLSDNIDLSAYPNASVNIAWFFTSTNVDSKRWTIDDVTIYPGIVLQPCAELTEQPTNLVLTSTSASVSGTYTEIAPPTTVQNYLIVRSLTTPLTQLPIDATNYTAGQVIGGGNGTVIGISADGTFIDNTIMPSTQYYYFVFAIEDQNCTGGPNYNQLLPLTATVTTPALVACTTPTAPTALTLTPSNTSITGLFTGSAASKYLVVISTNAGPLGATPVDGITYTAGQMFGNGTVVSIGTSTSFTANALTVSTPYYFYIFALNDACTGAPFYSIAPLNGTATTTNVLSGIPPGYYAAVNTQTCAPLKTVLFNIIKPTAPDPAPTYDGICTMYPTTDLKVSDFSSNNVIWDMYSDNPTGPDPYEFEYQVDVDGCGGSGANNPPIPGTTEGRLYNREHSFPKSWFGGIVEPMHSDALHIFPTDKQVNALRGNLPYGKVTTPTTTTLNGGKIGPNSTSGFSGQVFEPINAYKGDFARAHFYMITAYEDKVAAWQPNKTEIFNGNSYTAFDDWYLLLMYQWHIADPVSAKEINRNNAVYLIQGNRNPYIDHPEYVNAVFQCASILPVLLTDFIATNNDKSVKLEWFINGESRFKNYEIERSVDGRAFNKIGEVEGRNLASYNFTDNDLPRNAIVYYRLKMIDIDGRFTNSKIVSIKLNNNLSNALVYPNPTAESLNVKLYEVLQSRSTLQVTDVTGRIIMQKDVNVNEVNIKLDVKNLSAGRYFIKIANNTQIINQSFVVIK